MAVANPLRTGKPCTGIVIHRHDLDMPFFISSKGICKKLCRTPWLPPAVLDISLCRRKRQWFLLNEGRRSKESRLGVFWNELLLFHPLMLCTKQHFKPPLAFREQGERAEESALFTAW